MSLEDLVPGLLVAAQTAGRERCSEMSARSSLPAVRKGGERILVELSLSPVEPLPNEAGPERFVLAIVRDVTRRERHEAALREAQEVFRSAFDNAPIGVAVVGLDGRFVRVNRSLCELLGYPEEELLSLTFTDITHPEDIDASIENVRRLVEGEVASYSVEKRYVGAGGEAVWVSLSVSLVRDRAGETLYLVDQIKDITERRKATEELALRAEELARANAELEQFSYSVSHDLRAPLRAIDGFSRVLMEDFADDLGEEGTGYLMRVRANSQRMSTLIDDLLDLSRVTRSPLRRQKVDLSALSASVLDDLRRGKPDRSVEAAVEEGLVVNADAGLVRVVLENLLRARQRRRLRRGLRREVVRPLPAAARRAGVRGDRHRAGDGATRDPPPRRPDLGRERTRRRGDVLLHAVERPAKASSHAVASGYGFRLVSSKRGAGGDAS